MSASEAVDLLSTIGSIYGEAPFVFEQSVEEKFEAEIAEKTAIASERRSPFSFYKCGIQNGEQIVYVHDSSIVCTVANDREIFFNGKKTSLSALAKKLLNRSCGVQGTLHFTYNGEILSALRKRLEDEGKYIFNDVSDVPESPKVKMQINSDGVILYFTMEKYPAMCKWTSNGYLLLKGSKISQTCSPSSASWVTKLRKKNEDKISNDFFLTEDILFNSSSAVAAFVAGNNRNGKICWKNGDGMLLKDLLDKEV